MEHQRFDAALRALEAGTTRRKGLAAALGVILGGKGFDAVAKGKDRATPRPAGPCGPTAKDNRCTKNGDCCTKYCAQGECRCKPNWMACSKADHCCSGKCVGGVCDGGCKPAGSRCEENFNCCTGMICDNGTCTKSSKAKCTRQNCSGCCDGTTCRVGSDRTACGSNGGACSRCSGAQTCRTGACFSPPKPPPPPSCGPSTCAGGCCDGATCVTQPSGLACGAGGGACVICSSLSPICTSGACVTGTWSSNAVFGSQGSGNENMSSPGGVTASPDLLTAWVADTLNNRIVVWTRPNATSTTWAYSTQFGSAGSGDEEFNLPAMAAISLDTLTLWVADRSNHRIVIWTRPSDDSTAWSYSTQFGEYGTGNTQMDSPLSVAVSMDGLTAWIADSGNNRIVVWNRPDADSTSWSFHSTFGSEGSGNTNFDTPNDLSVSPDTLTVWIADQNNERVVIWTRPNATSTAWGYNAQFGSSGSNNDQFSSLYGVAASPDGLTVYTAVYGQSAIKIWTRTSASSTTWNYSSQFTVYAPVFIHVSADASTAWIADYDQSHIAVWTQS